MGLKHRNSRTSVEKLARAPAVEEQLYHPHYFKTFVCRDLRGKARFSRWMPPTAASRRTDQPHACDRHAPGTSSVPFTTTVMSALASGPCRVEAWHAVHLKRCFAHFDHVKSSHKVAPLHPTKWTTENRCQKRHRRSCAFLAPGWGFRFLSNMQRLQRNGCRVQFGGSFLARHGIQHNNP